MEAVRVKIKAKKYHFFKAMYRNGVDIGRISWLIYRKFPEIAKAVWAADGKCVNIEISMEIV